MVSSGVIPVDLRLGAGMILLAHYLLSNRRS